jgi:hypothetical protein
MLEDKMEFNLKINVDNDAYRSQAVQHQLIDNLNEIIAKLEDSWDYGTVKDVNGNTVGEWSLDV